MRYHLGDLEGKPKLDRRQPFGTERAAAIIQLEPAAIAIAKDRKLGASCLDAVHLAVDPDARFHGLVHLVAYRRQTLARVAPEHAEQPRLHSVRLLARSIAPAGGHGPRVLRRPLAGHLAEHHDFRERIGAEAV